MRPRLLSERALKAEVIRARIVPIASTLIGSAIILLPVISTSPMMPPFGLMILLCWRLLRPELWSAWVGLPLGLVDDMLSGQPLGTAMGLWTMILLIMDFVDNYLIWRDFWIDWLIGSVAMIMYLIAGYLISGVGATPLPILSAVPQILASLLCLPVIMRLTARLDRWRLSTRSPT